MSAAVVARAFLRKDALEALSHRGAWLSAPFGILITLLLLSGTARFIGEVDGVGTSLGEGGALGFLVIGIVLLCLHDALVRELPRRLRAAELEGTLEAVLAGGANPVTVACCLPLFPLGRALARGAGLLAAGALFFGLDLAWERALLALPLVGLATLLFAAIGLCFAAATLTFGRAEPVIALYGGLSALVGGVFFPVEALPAPLPELAPFVPLAQALGPLRGALLGTAGAEEALRSAAALAAGSCILVPASLFLLRSAIRRGLRDGTLGRS